VSDNPKLLRKRRPLAPTQPGGTFNERRETTAARDFARRLKPPSSRDYLVKMSILGKLLYSTPY
jgi:hypothetical protein